MNTLSRAELLPAVEQLIATLEEDDNTFYVATEFAYSLLAELTRILEDNE